MCDNCENDFLEENDDAAVLDLGEAGDISIGVLLNTEPLQNTPIDEKLFAKGVKEYSYYAGAFSVLANAGIPAELAVNFIMTKEIAPMNERIVKMKCDAQVQAAKNMRANMERDIL